MNAALAAEINRLTAAEKLQLVEELWDQLSASEERLPIPGWHEKILAEDQEEYRRNPDQGSSWQEVKRRIIGQP